ncbi:hypothetical protein GCM10023209_32720 [Roseibacterium beibuensis]|uniref:Uncharacterized protein n=2 Tax=[Roseibacterium] beibuensis TaxID=1193142 RepID=A0ABP9LKY1_9RHOB
MEIGKETVGVRGHVWPPVGRFPKLFASDHGSVHPMDVTALVFYAAICGLLSLASPRLGRPFIRLAVGAVVGIAAATLLPILRTAFGLG